MRNVETKLQEMKGMTETRQLFKHNQVCIQKYILFGVSLKSVYRSTYSMINGTKTKDNAQENASAQSVYTHCS
jgi:hypothetical protein